MNIIHLSAQELVKLANSRSTYKGQAEAEVARRVEKRHMANKAVPADMQRIANRYEDKQEAITAALLRAGAAALLDSVAQAIDAGQVRWVDDQLVGA